MLKYHGHGRAENSLWHGSGYGSGMAGSDGSGYGSGFGSDGYSRREGFGYSFGVYESSLMKGKGQGTGEGNKVCILDEKSGATSAISRLAKNLKIW